MLQAISVDLTHVSTQWKAMVRNVLVEVRIPWFRTEPERRDHLIRVIVEQDVSDCSQYDLVLVGLHRVHVVQ